MRGLALLALMGFVAAAVATDNNEIQAEKIVNDKIKSCGEQCADKYQASNERDSCEYGCRMFTILRAIPFTDGDLQKSKENCEADCSDVQPNEATKSSCRLGCAYGVEPAKARDQELKTAMDSFFDDMPRIHMLMPGDHQPMMGQPMNDPMGSMMSNFGNMMPDLGNMMPDFGNMFEKMHGEMNRMMQSLTEQVDKLEKGEVPEGTGRLVVVKSGPGYHHKKTYDFGPEGLETKTEEKTSTNDKSLTNDMMSIPNPLERLFNMANDVEVLPEAKKEEPEIAPVEDFFARDVLEPPKLPEHGLRSRDHHRPRVFVVTEDVCHQKSENMKWSDWVSCLHLRMGLPRWLTAATLSLGIVFVIWLCLVIPQSAPKQKVKMTKEMESQICFANVEPLQGVKSSFDAPPAYEDIAHLHVAISAAEERKRKEAEESGKQEAEA